MPDKGSKDSKGDPGKARDDGKPGTSKPERLRPQGEYQVPLQPMPPPPSEERSIHQRRPLPPVPEKK
ncbi:hypothetical protein ACFSQQ_15960 [Mesorhizobium kowhaii]|uniref:hypothetical protein n=1 Tax=Mesorhizobium kowhaii TaxID=1300272 RepID=UPI0035ECF4C7